VVFTGGAQAVALVETLASFLCRFAQRLVLHWKEVLRPAAGLDWSSSKTQADKQLAKQASKQERQRLKQQAKARSLQAAGAAADGTTDPTAASASSSTASGLDAHKTDDAAAAVATDAATAAVGPAWDWRYLQSALRLLAFGAEWARGVASVEAETAAALAALYQPLFQPTYGASAVTVASSSLSGSAAAAATNNTSGGPSELSGGKSSTSGAANAPGLMAVLAGPLEGHAPSATPGSAFAPQHLASTLALEGESSSSSSTKGGGNDDDDEGDDDDVGLSGVSMGDLLLDDKSSSSSGNVSSGRASAASWEACGRVEALSVVCGRRAIAQQLNPPEAKALKQLLLRAAHGDKLQMVHPASTTATAAAMTSVARGGSNASSSSSSGGVAVGDPLVVGSGLLAGARRDAMGVCAAARALVLDLGLKVIGNWEGGGGGGD